MKLLIYGAGVIGCFYGSLFSEAGYDVSIYARGKRLESLKSTGLQYKNGNTVKKAKVTIVSYIEADECYDFIFLTVREDQLRTALQELQDSISPTIVTMVNSLETYDKWEGICGKGKILPAFPGAGGSFKNDILDASLTPRIVQPTTFAEIGGVRSERLLSLAKIFKRSRIPYQIVADMHTWQLCHLAMVVPLADAYYDAVNPRKVGYEWKVMEKTARRMKRNYKALRRTGHVLSPKKMYLFCCMPVLFLTVGLKIIFLSNFGDKFMYRHAMKAPDEMRELHRQFYGYIKRRLGE